MTDLRHPETGMVVAGYLVEELIGRGGMGDVYRARDERLERNVALKILAPRYAEDDDFRERLLKESRLAASLDHPNVVPVYDAGEVDGQLFLAMRYVEGTDLKAQLRRGGALDAERAVEIAGQVADALDAAHAQGLVHRDVKPSNVLIDTRGHCYLADFGLTQSVSDQGPTDGRLMGTVDYAAPEQIRGDAVDGRADVYALGCLLFEALTGTVPFGGSSDVAVIYAHLQEEPPRASDRLSGLPSALDPVLARAMAKDREARHGTCAELVVEARSALGLTPSAPSRGRRALPVAVAVLAVAAAVAAGIALRGGGEPAAPPSGRIVGIDPVANEVTSVHRVSAHPGAVTTSATRVWAGDFRDGSLWRLDPATGDVERFTTTGEPRDLTALANDVYVASDGETILDGSVTRYDAVTGNREAGVRLLSCSVVAGDGVVWVAGCPYLERLSTDAGPFRVVGEVRVPFQQPDTAETRRSAMRDMAIGEGALWVLGDPVDRRVFKVDRTTGEILAITLLPFAPRSIAAGEGGVWVTGPIADVVARLDPASGRVTAVVDVPSGASGVGAGLGGVWVASALDGSVSRIDPRTVAVVKSVDVDGFPREVAVGAGGVWVTADDG